MALNAFQKELDRPKRLAIVPGTEIVTYLPLQVSLYFNVYYSPFWIVACVISLVDKYSTLASHYKFVTLTVYIIMFLVEACRLYLGYEGNLREKVPELAGFWLLTLFQTPITTYVIANVNTTVLPLERAATIILLLFLLVQVFIGFRSLQLMVRAQVIKFNLTQLDATHSLRDH